jgi:hypothetical protein
MTPLGVWVYENGLRKAASSLMHSQENGYYEINSINN